MVIHHFNITSKFLFPYLHFTIISHSMTKPTKWHVGPAKTQISLGIHSVWMSFFWASTTIIQLNRITFVWGWNRLTCMKESISSVLFCILQLYFTSPFKHSDHHTWGQTYQSLHMNLLYFILFCLLGCDVWFWLIFLTPSILYYKIVFLVAIDLMRMSLSLRLSSLSEDIL